MFQSPILDVATGLILVFLIVSLICTSINEYIAQVLGLRAEILWRAVWSLFQNSGKGAQAFAKQLYDHDLIDALSPPGERPSYIPSQVFSLALVDRLGLQTAQVDGQTPNASVSKLLSDAQAANSRKEASDTSKVDDRIFSTLMPLAVAAGSSVDAFRKNIESWFESAMQRATGWYKRRIQTITFYVALSLALVFNVDSLMLANTVWNSPTARSQLSSAAQHVSGAPGQASPNLAAHSPATQAAQAQVASLVGWSGPILPTMSGYDRSNPHGFPDGAGGWLGKLLGLLITAFAASLGAPFWFGVLSKVMSIRNAGVSPNDPTIQPARIVSNPSPGTSTPAATQQNPTGGRQNG